MGKPLYTPGSVRQTTDLRASLIPPAQSGRPEYWMLQVLYFSNRMELCVEFPLLQGNCYPDRFCSMAIL